MSQNKLPKLIRKRAARFCLIGALLVVLVAVYIFEGRLHRQTATPAPTEQTEHIQANHQNVRATMFWVGEPPDADNAGITNVASSWTGNWVKAFGGIDDPKKRCGYKPCAFTPQENAFYFALPYNDRQSNGSLKPSSELMRIPWYSGAALDGQSLLKNHWLSVTHLTASGPKTAYVQWEDVGPMYEDDINYVFGPKPPKFRAGLDLSPAANDYLDLQGEGQVSWRFVDASQVPDGPWKTTVTDSQLNYE
jgi:hypothetical protein